MSVLVYKWHSAGMAILQITVSKEGDRVQPVFFTNQDAARAWLEDHIARALTAEDFERFFAGAGFRA